MEGGALMPEYRVEWSVESRPTIGERPPASRWRSNKAAIDR